MADCTALMAEMAAEAVPMETEAPATPMAEAVMVAMETTTWSAEAA